MGAKILGPVGRPVNLYSIPGGAHHAPMTPTEQAFADYAALVRSHAAVPACWDDPDRADARNAAFSRYLELFEDEQ